MQAMKIFHALKGGVRRERLVHLSGQQREFIRRGDTVMCIDAINGLVKLGYEGAGFGGDEYNGKSADNYSSNYATRFAALREPYQVSFDGHGRVAGREVTLIALRPKDAYRYGFSLALDTETKLLLRSLMLNSNGKVLERFEYTQIDIGTEIPIADLESHIKIASPPAGAARTQTDRSGPTSTRSAWRVDWVPPAFTLSDTRSRKPASDASVAKIASEDRKAAIAGNESRRMYSDGLTAFSVFVEENSDLGTRSWRRGATTAHTVVKRDPQGLFSVTVVGELPLPAAQKIAASVNRVGSKAASAQ